MNRLALLFPWLCLLVWGAIVVRDQTSVPPQDDSVVASGSAPGRTPMTSRAGAAASPVDVDPVCRMVVKKSVSYSVTRAGAQRYFCSSLCRDEYRNDPSRFVTHGPVQSHLMRGIPRWMYQLGLALLLLVSFGFFELLDVLRERGWSRARPELSRFEITAIPGLLAVVRWRFLRPLAQSAMTVLFLVVIAAGLFGNQSPTANIAPLLTWTVWWVGLVFFVLFLGKGWCFVCPWDGIATLLERLFPRSPGEASGGLGLPWPRRLKNIWLAVGFFLLLTWIDLGTGITVIPRATAMVGLAMIALAVLSGLLFDRKAFCRYACLVGRVSGLYAMFGALELRARNRSVCQGCKTMDCFKGNDRGAGCPTFEFPRTMSLSTYCILCTECVRTCPEDNIALNLRPWGSDLVVEGKSRADEAALALVLLSMTAFHGLTMTPSWEAMLARSAALTGAGHGVLVAGWMALFMSLPVLVYAGLIGLAWVWARRHPFKTLFIEYAYPMLPIALFYHLAHNAEHVLMEGPRLLALLSDPFGWGADLFGTARVVLGPAVTLETLWGLQVGMVILGHVYGLWVSRRVTARLYPRSDLAFVGQLPMLVAMILSSSMSLWLLNQPMSMRTSAM